MGSIWGRLGPVGGWQRDGVTSRGLWCGVLLADDGLLSRGFSCHAPAQPALLRVVNARQGKGQSRPKPAECVPAVLHPLLDQGCTSTCTPVTSTHAWVHLLLGHADGLYMLCVLL